jgi:hypothetical protein
MVDPKWCSAPAVEEISAMAVWRLRRRKAPLAVVADFAPSACRRTLDER